MDNNYFPTAQQAHELTKEESEMYSNRVYAELKDKTESWKIAPLGTINWIRGSEGFTFIVPSLSFNCNLIRLLSPFVIFVRL